MLYNKNMKVLQRYYNSDKKLRKQKEGNVDYKVDYLKSLNLY